MLVVCLKALWQLACGVGLGAGLCLLVPRASPAGPTTKVHDEVVRQHAHVPGARVPGPAAMSLNSEYKLLLLAFDLIVKKSKCAHMVKSNIAMPVTNDHLL